MFIRTFVHGTSKIKILNWIIADAIIFSGYCLYGDDSDCVFKCHCAVDSECDGGICPSGCDGAPLGYNWRGPACQIGNIIDYFI